MEGRLQTYGDCSIEPLLADVAKVLAKHKPWVMEDGTLWCSTCTRPGDQDCDDDDCWEDHRVYWTPDHFNAMLRKEFEIDG